MMEYLVSLVYAFFHDPRVLTLLGLIVLDVLLGVAVAVRTETFDWRRLATFYRTMVGPYLLGYLGFYLCAKIMTAELLGPAGYLVGEGMTTLAWLTLVGTLAASVIDNARSLGYKIDA